MVPASGRGRTPSQSGRMQGLSLHPHTAENKAMGIPREKETPHFLLPAHLRVAQPLPSPKGMPPPLLPCPGVPPSAARLRCPGPGLAPPQHWVLIGAGQVVPGLLSSLRFTHLTSAACWALS